MVLRRRAGGQKSVWPRWQEYSSWCNTRWESMCVRSKPWYPPAGATLVRLWEKDLNHGPLAKITLGIGPGGGVTFSGVRFCSGLLFHSLAFHAAKQALLEGFSAMKDGIQAIEKEETPLLVYTSEWASCSQVHKALQDLGYTCTERTHLAPEDSPGERFVWKRALYYYPRRCLGSIRPLESSQPDSRGVYRMVALYVTGGGRELTTVEKAAAWSASFTARKFCRRSAYVRSRSTWTRLADGRFSRRKAQPPAGLAMVDDSGRIDGPAADGHGRIALVFRLPAARASHVPSGQRACHPRPDGRYGDG